MFSEAQLRRLFAAACAEENHPERQICEKNGRNAAAGTSFLFFPFFHIALVLCAQQTIYT